MNSTLAGPIADSHNPTPELAPANPLIEGVEKLEDWLAHREIVVQELCPVGAIETLYAQRAALYLWRLDRVTRYEFAKPQCLIEAGSPPTCEDPANAPDQLIVSDSPSLQTIIKYEAHLQRCLAGTMAELRRLQKERRQGLRDANSGGRGADRAGVCIPGGRGADRAGICEKEFVEKGSHGGSPSHKITDAEMPIPGARGADRAGICIPGGRGADRAGVCIPGGRGADRAGICENEFIEKGSHGGSPSQSEQSDI